MSMQMSARGLLFAACLAGCAPVQREQSYALAGVEDCAGVMAARGLRVYLLADQGWDELRFDGTAIRQSQAAGAPSGRIQRNDPDISHDIEERFPGESIRLATGEKLGFPAARSPDNKKWAAGILSEDRMSPTRLLIRDGAKFHRVDAIPGLRIETLAWSPQSDHVAVIEQNYDTRSRTFRDLISPHGVSYSDVVLRLYAPSGELACQTVVAKRKRTPQPLIEWSSE